MDEPTEDPVFWELCVSWPWLSLLTGIQHLQEPGIGKGSKGVQLPGGVWAVRVCQWGTSTQAGLSQRFAEDKMEYIETFAGVIREERSKELAFSLEKEEEAVG